MTGTKCTFKRLLMSLVWLYKFVTDYIRIENYFNKVNGFVHSYNFNSVCEGYFGFIVTLLCVLTRSATWWLWDCMFWRCRIYSWPERVVVTFRCQPVALRRTVLFACDATYCDTYVTTFRKNLLSPPSEWKCKQREERRTVSSGCFVTCYAVFTSCYLILFLSFYLWVLLRDTTFQ